MKQRVVTILRRFWRGTRFFPVNLLIMGIVCVIALNITPVHAERITLTAFNYPPYMDESVPEQGLFCELVSEAYQSVGYDVSFAFYPLKRSTQYVIEGKALAQLGTEWNFPEDARKNAVQSVPLFYYRVVGFYMKDRFSSLSFNTLKDLKDYRLGVILGSSDAAILKEDPALDVEEVAHMDQMFRKVYTGRNDIGFTVELSGLSFLKTHYPDEEERWMMTDDAIQGILGQVVFSKTYPESEKFLNAFKEGIQKIRDNGTYLRVFEKYYGPGKVPEIVSDITRELYVIPKE